MRGLRLVPLVLCLWLAPPAARAGGLTETLPRNTFLLDVSFYLSQLSYAYDNEGNLRPLFDEMPRYEPGGGLQGTIIPAVDVTYGILAPQLQYGITDYLSVGLGVPIALFTEVEPRLRWETGDYYWPLGRSYTEEDFWGWAESMGQPKPGYWYGNQGVPGDMILGLRYRFTDHIPAFQRAGWAMALMIMGALPTGEPADPEEVVTAGTTSWDLHSQGELNFHLAIDKFFRDRLDGRLTISLDLFYEIFFRHEYQTPRGERHPLLLSFAPYAGDTYTLDPGDFIGGSIRIEGVPYRGPARATWLVGHDPERARALPPILTISAMYTFTYVFQSDWESDSPLWDWGREETWRPGYKNILTFQLNISFLRLGAPIQLYVRYRNQTWIGGRNVRAADVWTFGLQAPFQIWGRGGRTDEGSEEVEEARERDPEAQERDPEAQERDPEAPEEPGEPLAT